MNAVPYTYLYAKTICGKIIEVSVTTGNICSSEADLRGLVLFHFRLKPGYFIAVLRMKEYKINSLVQTRANAIKYPIHIG